MDTTAWHPEHNARLSRYAQSTEGKASDTKRLVIQVPRFVIVARPGGRVAQFWYKGLEFEGQVIERESDGWLVRDPVGADGRHNLRFSFTERYVKLKGQALHDVQLPDFGGEA